LAITQWSLLVAASHYGFDHDNGSHPEQHHLVLRRLIFASSLLYPLVTSFVKISIACMLLRHKSTRSWDVFLWILIVLQIAACTVGLVFRAMHCPPLAFPMNLERNPNTTCRRADAFLVSIYVEAGIGSATNLMFAAIPFTFLNGVHGSVGGNIGLSLMILLGVFATAASIRRTTLLNSNHRPIAALLFWSILEEQAGIAASCIPSLAPLFDHTLNRFSL
ncbi:hypothetical protein CC80DRAFT_395064, partial [Byssothecium circinans]